MTFNSGTRLASYEIVGPLGAGGMGEVYRARDSKLKREVAIKVLPDFFARDAERVSRFQREAEVLASLNHAHIAGIYDIATFDEFRFLVLELVEGETLADLIRRGPIPLAEALSLARQMAEALAAAHEKGIVHRDFKPANIKVTPDGSVKVLDFGLAKVQQAEKGVTDPSNSPTMVSAYSTPGMILGTAAYMSPEQARGLVVDKQSDIWAFGCVLFEMLSGQHPFPGEDITDRLATVLKSDPNWNALPSTTPRSIRALIHRCLERDRRRRVSDISTALFVIDELENAIGTASTAVRPPKRQRIAMLAAAILSTATLTGTIAWFATRPAPPSVTTFTIAPSGAAALTVVESRRDMAIAPDGSRIVYVGGNGTRIFARSLDQLDPTPLTGGADLNPNAPFFSPDSQWIGYFNSNLDLRKVAVTGGPPIPLWTIKGDFPGGATWSENGTIVYATIGPVGLRSISDAGGTPPNVLTTPNRMEGEANHVWPQFLPGGHAVLFTITATQGGSENSKVALFDLRTSKQKTLVRGGSHAHYVSSGHLVYGLAGTLRAIAFDLDDQVTIGKDFPVLPGIVVKADGSVDFDVARNGTLAYISGGARPIGRTLVWVDRQAREELIKVEPRIYVYARLSPDGSRIALDIRDKEYDIWIWHIAREMMTRVTFDPGLDRYPVWLDDRRLAFCSNRDGTQGNTFLQVIDETGPAEPLTRSPNFQCPMAATRDGMSLVIMEEISKQPKDLLLLGLDKERRTQPLVQSQSVDQNGIISPDGRWLAYESDESTKTKFEIYVQPFPDAKKQRWQISIEGGRQPLWARSGQELFYLAPNGDLMSVSFNRETGRAAGAARKLFGGPYLHGNDTAAPTYDVFVDDTKFLMIKQAEDSQQRITPPSLVIVQNWLEDLRKLGSR